MPGLDDILDDHRRGCAAIALLARLRRHTSQPYICPAAAMALLSWQRTVAAGRPATLTIGAFCREHYRGSNANYNVRQLQAAGLIHAWRHPSSGDRRVTEMRLSDAGLAWCSEMAVLLAAAAPAAPPAAPVALAA